MKYTISKKKQPVHSSFLKQGKIFYRVKGNGVYLEDFRTKTEALNYVNKLRRRRKR